MLPNGMFPPETDSALQPHFYSILNLLKDGVYISNREGSTLYVNDSWQRLTGVSSDRVLGHRVTELLEMGVFDAIVNPDVVRTGKVVTRVQKINGRSVVLHGHPVFDARGRVELVVTFVRDITTFNRMKEEIATQKSLIQQYQRQVSSLNPEEVFLDEGMVAVSRESEELLHALDTIAPTEASVLILGETGVGKDMVARRLHKKSRRSAKPFIKVDCTTIPESLVESELFGYESGAFSGAKAKGKRGLFEDANGGTLFLDEIGELNPHMQTKLLRALQDQEIIRVGSTKVTPIDVRILAATNRDLGKSVAEGTFRSDLYYRLKVAVLHVLPLRQRRDDILPLAKVFLHRFNAKYGKSVRLTSKAENALLRYSWPGNIRELENMIHGLVVSSEKPQICCADLPVEIGGAAGCATFSSGDFLLEIGSQPLKEIVRKLERAVIEEALAIYGSVSKAAEALQVNRTTIFRKTKND
ncbi:PAS domain S-box-containing protein [Desulfacinum infernum DSM 9756]|uniref:HTH-type transcriptional regulatory protein TyrR n=1 Tax=Desulfacinum infernum DSM 9756 TaxID=1121391 RepID=A0A1M5HDW5_9BACT|nr:sigma 54-interacting transcriptional regulator [Desulfacinum infernum]SHG14107.1 PAS domain S-box-containing protein [Desulfacinum infernum DSM 9756]